jgi:hypothetical protein
VFDKVIEPLLNLMEKKDVWYEWPNKRRASI